jgi:hypothetical protein
MHERLELRSVITQLPFAIRQSPHKHYTHISTSKDFGLSCNKTVLNCFLFLSIFFSVLRVRTFQSRSSLRFRSRRALCMLFDQRSRSRLSHSSGELNGIISQCRGSHYAISLFLFCSFSSPLDAVGRKLHFDERFDCLINSPSNKTRNKHEAISFAQLKLEMEIREMQFGFEGRWEWETFIAATSMPLGCL